MSLVAVRLHLSWGRLRSSEIAAYRRGFALPKPPVALGFPPMGDVCVVCDVCPVVLCCVVLWCVEVYGVLCGLACFRFTPLWETSVWYVVCGVCCVVLCCCVLRCMVCCVV